VTQGVHHLHRKNPADDSPGPLNEALIVTLLQPEYFFNMKATNLFFIVLLLSANISCKKEKSDPKSQNSSLIVLKESSAEYSDALLDPSSVKSAPFTLDSLLVQGDKVEVTVSYPGGCIQHSFEIIWNETVTYSNPPEVSLAIIHNANGDSCEAYITEVLTFNLGDLIDSTLAETVSVAAFSSYNPCDSTVYERDKFDFTLSESDVCNMTVTAGAVVCGWGLYDNIWFATEDSVTSGMEGFYFRKYLQPVSSDPSLYDFRPVPGKKYTLGARYDYSTASYPGTPVCMAYSGPSIPVRIMCINVIE
jgi:hypothetical protein